jgi:putrescine transport system permease protein
MFTSSLRSARWAEIPFSNVMSWGNEQLQFALYFGNYARLVCDPSYLSATYFSLKLSILCALFVVPFALFFALATLQVARRYRELIFVLVLIPMFIPFIVRLYSWLSIAQMLESWLDRAVIAPFTTWMFCCCTYLPVSTALIREAIKKIDPDISDAARDLGASPWIVFKSIVVPLSTPAILHSAMIVMVLSFGEFVVPELLSGGELFPIGAAAHGECFAFHDLPMSSALSVFMLVWSAVPLIICRALLRTLL